MVVLISLTVTDVSADEVGPEITDIFHVPNYPLYGENVTVYATVTDPDGLDYVRIQFCIETSCTIVYMDGPDANNMFWGTIPWEPTLENGTIIHYDIKARDNNLNTTTTEELYYFYASGMNADTDAENSIFLGDSLNLIGQARYDGNETAYVVNSNVTVRITETGKEYYTTTDMDGNFSLEDVRCLGPVGV